jgi:predicted HicB family RNase H-like nuclease
MLRKMLSMKEAERFNMVLPKWLKEAVKQAAESKGVGMSEYVKDVLKDAVKRDLPAKTEAAD